MPTTKVNITKLKKFALEKLPKDSVLRDILLSQNEEEIEVSVFLARLPVWLQLNRFKGGKSS